MKQIFFKTVHQDGTSIWAIGRFKIKYKIGGHYNFDPRTPAHVFGLDDKGQYRICPRSDSGPMPEQTIDHERVYRWRAEQSGNRVFICYGEVYLGYVPRCTIEDDWDLVNAEKKYVYVSHEFDVIGEIKPKRRDEDIARPNYNSTYRVICDLDDQPSTKI